MKCIFLFVKTERSCTFKVKIKGLILFKFRGFLLKINLKEPGTRIQEPGTKERGKRKKVSQKQIKRKQK